MDQSQEDWALGDQMMSVMVVVARWGAQTCCVVVIRDVMVVYDDEAVVLVVLGDAVMDPDCDVFQLEMKCQSLEPVKCVD